MLSGTQYTQVPSSFLQNLYISYNSLQTRTTLLQVSLNLIYVTGVQTQEALVVDILLERLFQMEL